MSASEGQPRRDLLRTSPVEAQEMEQLINKGLNAHNTVGALTFVGLAVLVLLGLYYQKLDKLGVGDTQYRFAEYLDALVHNQVQKDVRSYVTRGEVTEPVWPRKLYAKLRLDLYLVVGAALLLALVFVHVEKAKLRRSDLLVYRCLAREIEKLRLRVKQLETGVGDGAKAAAPPGTGDAGEAPSATQGVAPPSPPGATSATNPSEAPTETGL